MIAFISGKVLRRNASAVVVENSGIGYSIYVTPQHSLELLTGSQVEIHIAQVFREDSVSLYGFTTDLELDMFQLLCSVNGVGPKSALSIIGQLGVTGLQEAVSKADDSMFRSVSGIGPKTAKLIVLSLSGKLVLETDEVSNQQANILSALINLGYQEKPARAAIRSVSSSSGITDDRELLKQVLAELAKTRKVGPIE